MYTKAHDLLDCKSSFCWCMYIVGGNNSDWRSKFRFFVIRIYSLYTSDEKKKKKTRESLKPGSRRRHFILSYGIFLRLTHRDDTFFSFLVMPLCWEKEKPPALMTRQENTHRHIRPIRTGATVGWHFRAVAPTAARVVKRENLATGGHVALYTLSAMLVRQYNNNKSDNYPPV